MNEWKYLFTRKASWGGPLNSSLVHTLHHIHRFYFYLTDHTRKTILHERIIWNILKEIFYSPSVHILSTLSPSWSTHTQRILTSASPEVPFPKMTLLFIYCPCCVVSRLAYSPKTSPLPYVNRLGDLSESHCIHLETQRLRNSVSLQLWNSWIAWNV